MAVDKNDLLHKLASIKEAVYTQIRQILSHLIAILTRSLKETKTWVQEDSVGQLVASAAALIAFYAAVAAFAVWNISLLSGSKSQFAMPTQVTAPRVKLPNPQPSSIHFQTPQWKAPKFTTHYSNSQVEAETSQGSLAGTTE